MGRGTWWHGTENRVGPSGGCGPGRSPAPEGKPPGRPASRAGLFRVDPHQRAWHNHLAPVQSPCGRPLLVQTSNISRDASLEQCRRSPAVKEALLQEICRDFTNCTCLITVVVFDDDS